jgi:hypothetical protein
MSEWWTYRLSDFLMFTSSTYFRLFELSNRQWFPLQLVFLAAAFLTLYYITRKPQPVVLTAAGMLFGFAWIWVAWEFHWVRYTPVMLAGPYFAGLFLLEGVALAVGGRFLSAFADRTRFDARLGLGLVIFGLVLLPPLAFAFGRPFAEAQFFGVAPDPTVVATIGFLFFIRANWSLFLLPILWLVISAATLSTLEVPDTWVMLAVLLATVAGLSYRRFAR